MLKWFMKRRLGTFGRAFGYDTSYAVDLIDGDPAAGFALARLSAAAVYHADAPAAGWYAAKIVAAMSEDCGPCVQLAVTMAGRGGVSASDLRAIVAGEVVRMSADASLGYRFATAVIERSEMLDELRGEIVERWGGKALGAVSVNIATTRAFPTLKHALGHGRSCRSVEIGGTAVAPARLAHA
jgi:hypothetical protein